MTGPAATPSTWRPGAALAGVVPAVLVLVGSAAGLGVLVLALLVVVGVLAVGWSPLLALPSQRGSAAVVAGSGTAAVLVVALTPQEPVLRWVPAVLALSVLVAFVQQLVRHDLRPRLVESVTGAVTGIVLAVLAAGWAGTWVSPAGPDLVAAGALAAAVAGAVRGLPWGPGPVAGAALLAGTGASAAMSAATSVPTVPAAVAGFGVAVVVVTVGRLLVVLPTSGSRQSAATIGAAAVAASGSIVYVVGRVLGL